MNPIFTKKTMGFNMPPQQMMAPSPEMTYQAPPQMMQMADRREKKRSWALTALGLGGVALGIGMMGVMGSGALQVASGAADAEIAGMVAQGNAEIMAAPEYVEGATKLLTEESVKHSMIVAGGVGTAAGAGVTALGGVALKNSTKE